MTEERPVTQGEMYHIRVKGILDEKWADWFEGFVMTSRAGGETLLSGPAVDQSALHGALSKIRGLGLPLLLVAQTECPCPSRGCARHGQCHECAAHYGVNGKLPYCFREKTKWDKQCIAQTITKQGVAASENAHKTPRCANCALRKRAEAEPRSLLGRLWYWHIKWCPGWKAYQEHVAGQQTRRRI